MQYVYRLDADGGYEEKYSDELWHRGELYLLECGLCSHTARIARETYLSIIKSPSMILRCPKCGQDLVLVTVYVKPDYEIIFEMVGGKYQIVRTMEKASRSEAEREVKRILESDGNRIEFPMGAYGFANWSIVKSLIDTIVVRPKEKTPSKPPESRFKL